MQVTIDKFGRILIPKRIRQLMGMSPGRTVKLVANEEDRSLFLVPVSIDTTLFLTEDKIPVFTFSEPEVIDFDIVDLIKTDREERANKLWSSEE